MSTTFTVGEPCWVSLSTPHVPEAVEFYRRLFGWSAEDQGERFGGYRVALLDDEPVGGIGPSLTEGDRPRWTPFFASDDPEATAATVADAGGTVLVEPMDVHGRLTMTVCAAPDGAVFGAARLTAVDGLTRWGRPGNIGAFTLLADETEAADFYRRLFGWRFDPATGDADITTADGTRAFGNLHVMDPVHRPPGARPSWIPVFAVEDVDALAVRATGLGAAVPVGPVNLTDTLRTAFVVDPFGAGFSVAT